jgi:PRTRC genetic system protein C
MRREFSFLGIRLQDPDSRMTVEDVRGVLSMQYPEIATAAISGPEAVGDTMKYTFERAIEIRGASAFFGGDPLQGSCV